MWVKVCGVRDRETALRLADIGVDAIGLNFFAKSPRRITIEEAAEIARVLPNHINRVGVFVNHAIDELISIADRCKLDAVQLHGDESASYLFELQKQLPEMRLIRAWRMGADGLTGLAEFLELCRQRRCPVAACLVDAHVEGVYGGSGKTVSWERLKAEYQTTEWPPLILAGGLTEMNVAEAIAATIPWGVDTASGVESSPGIKDLERAEHFVRNAKNL